MHHPTFGQFKKRARLSTAVTVYRQLVSDTLTPVTAFSKLKPEGNAFLFESVIGGEKVGRYSIIGAESFLHIDAKEMAVNLNFTALRPGLNPVEFTRSLAGKHPLESLQTLLDQHQAIHVPGLPRFCGGAVGYMAYDTVRYTELLPNPPVDDRGLPDFSFDFYDSLVIFDHIQKTVTITAHALIPKEATGKELRLLYDNCCERCDNIVEKLQNNEADIPLQDIQPKGPVNRSFTSNFKREDFEASVEECKEYIRAGDIFQVVISQRLETETTASPFDVYRTLRVVNPSPFMFYLKTGDVTLVGASPEIMVRVEDDLVTIRPLAGTRKRGATAQEDEALAEELLADPKERAEHIMLVDLGRNDVGRVSRYQTVQLSEIMTVERYSHVMHITSNVTGRLAENRTALDALRACLPAGTVSGAPKVRAMEIIDELEPQRRGPYGGAVGYIDFTGNMDTCIALRTLVFKDNTVYLQAGAGIVYDSVPSLEYEETISKASGLLKAIEIAESQMSSSSVDTDEPGEEVNG